MIRHLAQSLQYPYPSACSFPSFGSRSSDCPHPSVPDGSSNVLFLSSIYSPRTCYIDLDNLPLSPVYLSAWAKFLGNRDSEFEFVLWPSYVHCGVCVSLIQHIKQMNKLSKDLRNPGVQVSLLIALVLKIIMSLLYHHHHYYYHYYYHCMCLYDVCGGLHAVVLVWRSEDSFVEWAYFFIWGLENQT